jgi:hypothetical protein
MRSPICRACLTMLAAFLATQDARAGGSEDLAFFESKIRPVLVEHCYRCHSAGTKKPKGKLLLDSRDGLRRGGESGPALVPGDPDKSLFIRAVRYTDAELRMPPDQKLPASVIADLEAWVKRGAPDPRKAAAVPAAVADWDTIYKARRRWWSLQPARKPQSPAVTNVGWSTEPIDRLVLARLEEEELTPGNDADGQTLVRRLSLVLTGLPPSADVAAKPQAPIEQVVDRLLASPHFGEHWARHWMDVVRFAETHGNEWNYEVHHAWRYRDYLVRAFNDDVPYNRLVLEHLAGDLLPPRWNQREHINESLIGTAFWRFGEVNHDDCVEFRQIGYDLFDNQLDALGKTFLATTVACARCHDHKLDAISMKDYYALLGVLRSSRLVSHTIDAPGVNAEPRRRLRALKEQIRAEIAARWLEDCRSVARYLAATQGTLENRPEGTALGQALDSGRVEAWRKAISAKVEMDDPAFVWQSLAAAKSDFAGAWKGLAGRIEAEQCARSEFNAKQFVPLGDFRQGTFDGWQAVGQGLDGTAAAGDFIVDCDGGQAVRAVYPAGAYTHGLSSKLNGVLRSPLLLKGNTHVSFQVLGGKTAAARIVSNNCQFAYVGYKALTKPDWHWITLTIPQDSANLRCYAELMTKFDNPKFPDQLGTLGGDTHNDRVPWDKAAADPRSFFGITRAVLHDGSEPPRTTLTHLRPLITVPPADLAHLAAQYASAIETAVRAWAAGTADDDAVRWLDWCVRRGLFANDRKLSSRLDALVTQYRATEKSLSLPRIVPGIAEAGACYDQPVLTRGDYHRPGDPVARRFLTMLDATEAAFTQGSGRLELAQRIASADNPLTARVIVNRVWHHLFGAGLVRTVDDFGHLGDRPSHPELLDYLAATFIEDGWSLKKLIRRIVLSRTFRMTPRSDPDASTIDPDNRLLHHYPARRLEAEAIRDAILATSGRLDRTLFGQSVDPGREKANPDRRLFPGPLDGAGRRSLYIKVNLMEPPKFLGIFDFPGGKVTRGRRDVTNVPGQALALLNDPFVLQQADFWAQRLVKDADATTARRIERMFRIALGRPPAAEERDRFQHAVDELARLHGVAADDVLAHHTVWRDVAHAFFNLKEFIFVP